MAQKADARATKDFFIHMITRDISLEDCIFDLIDNSIDGAKKDLKRKRINRKTNTFKNYGTKITLAENRFTIEDNCGGITHDEALRYAFRFGRDKNNPQNLEDQPIGLYGIGMKRAVFKIGELGVIESSTKKERFKVEIDVPAWESMPDEWKFDFRSSIPKRDIGTKISITNLNKGIAREITDKRFANILSDSLAKIYYRILQEGFSIQVNNKKIQPVKYTYKVGPKIRPLKTRYKDPTGISVEITAGMSELPPIDDSAEAKLKLYDYYGWTVSCNDRCVLTGNKDLKTGWGIQGCPKWHPQYHGFLGTVSFKSKDPKSLPWTTTKRDVEFSDPAYRRVLTSMIDAARQYTRYTNARKGNLEQAERYERNTKSVPIQKIKTHKIITIPEFKKRIPTASISYSKPKSQVSKVAESLGDQYMSNKEVGSKTFDFYFDNEISDT